MKKNWMGAILGILLIGSPVAHANESDDDSGLPIDGLSVPTLGSGSGEQDVVQLATVKTGARQTTECTGTLSEVAIYAKAEVSLITAGPIRILGGSVTVAGSKTYWEYTCRTTYTLEAMGWNGVNRVVTLEYDPNGGNAYQTLDICEYTGLPKDSSCTASRDAKEAELTAAKSGVAEKGQTYPSEMRACVGGWIRGVNTQAPVSIAALDAVSESFTESCQVVQILYTHKSPPPLPEAPNPRQLIDDLL